MPEAGGEIWELAEECLVEAIETGSLTLDQALWPLRGHGVVIQG